MDICEKVAYIKGLAEGLSLDESTKEGKILAAVIDVLSDITDEICEIEDGCDELMEQLDAVDEDLSNVEDIIYGDDDCDCCDCGDDDDFYEVTCSKCGETTYITGAILDEGKMECPNCGEELEFDVVVDEDDGCSCGCDCGCGDK